MKYRERRRKFQNLVEKLVAVCVERNCLREDISLYVQEHIDLAIDITTVLDEVKVRTQKELMANFHNLRHNISPPPLDNNITPNNTECNKLKFKVAIEILGEATQKGCNRMRTARIEQVQGSKDNVPSYYILTKNRPEDYRLQTTSS